jgi:myo-inositol-1(or 4)-monophosphatase
LPVNKDDLDLLVSAARAAGQVAMRHWKNDPKVWHKPDDQGPVTEADYEVDALLQTTLCGARPDYGWLSEETADSDARLSAKRTFIVDPIDGTRAFIGGDQAFSHALSVVEDGAVVAAAVYLPALDRMFTASLDGGAFLNGEPLHVSDRGDLTGARILAARPVMDDKHWTGPVPDVTRHLRPSLAYRLCLIAQGRFDAMVSVRPSWHWDTAAGSLIVTEAGGVIADRTGATIRYNTPSSQSMGILAGGPDLMAQILPRLAYSVG